MAEPTSISLREYFEAGLTYQQFTGLAVSKFFNYQTNYQRTVMTAEDQAFFADLPLLQVLIIAEAWCGDVVSILPIIMRACDENPSITVKICPRSDHPALMDNYRSNGKRSVPKMIIMNKDFAELTTWGPRPKAAQKIYNQYAGIKSAVIRDGVLFVKIKEFYRHDQGKAIIAELRESLSSLTTSSS